MSTLDRVGTLTGLALSLAVSLFLATAVSAKSGRKPHPPVSNSVTGVTLDLSDFGGVGDGVADNGPAFQSALDTLAASGGGTLLIPAGQYLVATPVLKDFSGAPNMSITIRGIPSSTMPAPPSAAGEQLAEGLDLASRIIPATGTAASAFTFTHLTHLLVEHIGFTGRENQATDAFFTLHFVDIDDAIVRHCEFYGLSTFATSAELGPGNIVRATSSELSIESSVFLGCTGNSGTYGAVVENLNWRRFNINNSIFLDYGLGPFLGKTGLGSPISWIDIGNAAPATAESPWREAVVRDTFLDEGGWVGISAFPSHWGAFDPIDLVYISGIKLNVSNLGTWGHSFYDLDHLLIENSYYGWSHNSNAALDLHRVKNAILDELTCAADATSIWANDSIGKLTVINSEFEQLLSDPQKTTVLNTASNEDPVQYVRQQFTSVLNRPPDAAAHFYWSNILISCGQDDSCLNQKRSQLSEYLGRNPQPSFSFTGTVVDQDGAPVSGVTATLNGQRQVSAVTDSEGAFRFSNLPTSAVYTIEVSKRHYHFETSTKTFALPATNVSVNFDGQLDRHSISGRITRSNGVPMSGVSLQLAESPTSTVTTDTNGNYSFSDLPAGAKYTVVPGLAQAAFSPASMSFDDLSTDQTANFVGQLTHVSIGGKAVDTLGNSLSEADVSLTGSQSAHAVTDAAGNFNFPDLPVSGTYTVSVSKRHYTFATAAKTFPAPDQDLSVTFTGELNRHSIKGTIKRTNDTALSDVRVQLNEAGPSVTADVNGTYLFTDLPAGQNYTVVPSSDNFLFTPEIKIEGLSTDQTADFVGHQIRVSIEGKVVDTLGDTLGEVNVSLTGSQSANAVTDSEGNFNFSNLPASGTYTVSVSSRHYRFETNTKTFTAPDEDLSVTFTGEINRHSIKGIIKRTNGSAISGVNVQLTEHSIHVVTDVNGGYSFPDLPAGQTYTIVPTLDGFEFASPSVQIGDLSADVTSDFVGKLIPELLSSEETDVAIALDSVSFLSGPFPLLNPNSFGTDRLTRIILFVRNSEEISGPAQVTLVATDKDGNSFPLEVEQVTAVPGQPTLKQLNVKLSPALPTGDYITINVSLGGVQSNIAKIRIATGQ